MDRKPVYGDRWSESTLEHAERIGKAVYLRAASRPVTWSPVKQKICPQEEDCEGTTLDEAFASMVNFLHQASKECRKYHCNHELAKGNEDSVQHCKRFHKVPRPVYNICKGNLFQREETVHLTLPRGSYSVTAHKTDKHGTVKRRTNIVHVTDTGGFTLDLSL